jgi:hypothetical protein
MTHKKDDSQQKLQIPNWVIVVLALVAIFNIAWLGLRIWKSQQIRHKYISAQGIVVDITVQRPEKSPQKDQHYPVVEFTTTEGKTVLFKSREGTLEPKYQTGQMVNILYDRERPYVAIVE